MTKGSVYFYFGSKEAVLLELLNQAEQIVIDRVLRLLESSEGSAIEKVVAFLHHQSLLGVSERENMLLIILMSLEFEDGPVARKVKALYLKFYDGLNNVIRDGQKDSEFRIGETGPPEARLHDPLDEAFAIIDRWRSLSIRHKKDAVPEGHGKFQGG